MSQETIFVVDDIPDNLGILFKMLEADGFKVLIDTSGRSALRAIEQARPDLILLDVLMPEMDGLETCRCLKANPSTRSIPVIFMTALDALEDKLKGFDAGAVDYVTKPIQAKEVLIRIRTHLTLRQLHQEVESRNAQLQREIAVRQQAEHTLQQAHDELEQRVRERTAALESSNLRLQQEIDERKNTEQRLQAAYNEIQRLKNRLERENRYLQEEIRQTHNFADLADIIGQSRPLQAVLKQVEMVAPTDTTVLLLGETGTGKELFARAIHHASARRQRPLIKVDCATLPANLIESELFGHEPGAFTGADSRRIGRFEIADGATMLLDEIGELPLELQAKLLRVLQDGAFERLGSSRTITADVRIIAATNRDLLHEVRHGRFRQDLYYRLSVYTLTLPPLRQRRDDLPLLVQAISQRCCKKLGRRLAPISPATLEMLQAYAWPGNVRELENIIERAIINSPGTDLQVQVPQLAMPAAADQSLEEVERRHIMHVLEKTAGKVAGPGGAADILKLHPNTLRSRMQKLGITLTKSLFQTS